MNRAEFERSLRLFNGHLHTIALDEKGKQFRLLDHKFYSNRDPHFLSSAEQKAFFNGKLESSCQPDEQARYNEIQQVFEEDLAHSTNSVPKNDCNSSSGLDWTF